MTNYYTNLFIYVSLSCIFSFFVLLLDITNTVSAQDEVGNGNDIWMVGKPLPTPRTEVTAASLNNLVYVIGGFTNDGRISNLVEAYNTSNNFWNKNINTLPIPLHHTVASTYDGKIYVIGGYTGDWIPSDRLFIYDPIINNWTSGPSMPTARGSPVASFVDGILYVIGGDLHDNPLSNVEAYDTNNRTWVTLSSMPTSRHHAASAVVDGKIYVIGGRITDSLVNVDILEKYDPVSDTWTADLSPMPSKRSGIAAASVGDLIYVFGGEQNQNTFKNNEIYDSTSDKWLKGPSMPTARHGLGVASVDDNIYVIGGGPHPGLTVTDKNEVYLLNSKESISR